jgi:hypothetical protein
VTDPIPELDPPVAARLAARPGGIETWPDIALLAPQLALPSDLRLRQLARSDIPRMIALLPTWFPELVGSSREGLLTASYYEESVALAGEDASIDRRPVYAFVIESGTEPVAFGCGEYRAAQALLRAEIGAVAPGVRGSGLAAAVARLLVLVGRTIGADMVIAWATLRHRLAQRMGERAVTKQLDKIWTKYTGQPAPYGLRDPGIDEKRMLFVCRIDRIATFGKP